MEFEMELPRSDVISRSKNKRQDDRAERDYNAEHQTARCCGRARARACVCACVKVGVHVSALARTGVRVRALRVRGIYFVVRGSGRVG